MSKPTFVFIPGAWHPPTAFDPVAERLKKAGYSYVYVALPCVGAEPPHENFDQDVAAVRDAVQGVLDAGNDAVVVMHSYGGVPGSEGLKGVSGKGKVKRLVYCTAFAFDVGGCLMAALAGQPLTWFDLSKDPYVYPIGPEEIFYNDMSPEAQKAAAATLKHHSYPTFRSVVTYAPWKTIPSTYIVCEKDNAIPPQAQEGMVQGAQAVEPTSFDVVEKIDAGHSPFLSKPDEMTAMLVKAAGA